MVTFKRADEAVELEFSNNLPDMDMLLQEE
jgi:hypothetical protein